MQRESEHSVECSLALAERETVSLPALAWDPAWSQVLTEMIDMMENEEFENISFNPCPQAQLSEYPYAHPSITPFPQKKISFYFNRYQVVKLRL